MKVDISLKNFRRTSSALLGSEASPKIFHQPHPAVADSLIDSKRRMPRPEAGMASLVQCKSEVPRTYRSGNLGGAARPLEDHLPGRLALGGRLEGLVDKRRRLTLRNLPRQSWNKFRVLAFPLALLIEKLGAQFLTKNLFAIRDALRSRRRKTSGTSRKRTTSFRKCREMADTVTGRTDVGCTKLLIFKSFTSL
jgi:hypothetical protein